MLSIRTRLARAAAAAGSSLALALLVACGGSSTPPVPPVTPVASVSVTPGTSTLNVGGTVQLTATPQSSTGAALTGRTITWSSSSAAATVSASGLVTAVAGGTATITATVEGIAGTATVTISSPRPVRSVVITPSPAQVPEGQSLPLSAQPRDSAGTVLLDRTVTWSSADTLIARVGSGTGVLFGVRQGTTTVTATSETVSAQVSVTVTPIPVARVVITPNGAALQTGATRTFTGQAVDANNQPIANRTITWSSSVPSVASINATSGLATASAAGTTFIRAATTGRTDSVLVTVTVGPPPVASVSVTPNPVSLLPGATFQLRPVTRDVAGAVLTGRAVTYQTSSSAIATVSSTGLVTATGVGNAVITVTSEGVNGTAPVQVPFAASQFNLDIENIGPAFSGPVQEAFNAAESYWESAIIGDITDFQYQTRTTGICGAGTATFSNRAVDDIVILARIDSIDGRGAVLGSAGPCSIRSGGPSDGLTIVGIMSFDSADVAGLITAGQLRDVIRHEMGHVLGIGTLWDLKGCLQDRADASNTQDTFFSCAQAQAAFQNIGGETYVASRPVPVENCFQGVPASCGGGTRNGHWREFTFRTELMTGFLQSGVVNPNSVLTVASLGDLGYVVNLGVSESYVLPGSALAATLRGLSAFGGYGVVDLTGDIRTGPIEMHHWRTGQLVRTLRPRAP